MNKEITETCVLCGLPVEVEGFTLNTEQGLKKFCCAGCLCMYQLLNENTNELQETTTINNQP